MSIKYFNTKNKTFLNNNHKLYSFLLILCICVLIFSFYNIVQRVYSYYRDDKNYEEIKAVVEKNDDFKAQKDDINSMYNIYDINAINVIKDAKSYIIDSNAEETNFTNNVTEEETPLPYTIESGNIEELDSNGILLDYSTLKKENKDLVGWIYMPGFEKEINYPVMQAQDNEFYLDKDFYGNSSKAGSIFMDYRNNPADIDRNIILYGHAMFNLSMFGNLMDYFKQEEEHSKITKIYLDLMNMRLEYEVFSTYLEHSSYNYRQVEFSNDSEYLDFLKRIASRSEHNYNIELSPKDKILTLSTCDGNIMYDGRSVIHARLVKQTIYEKNGG